MKTRTKLFKASLLLLVISTGVFALPVKAVEGDLGLGNILAQLDNELAQISNIESELSIDSSNVISNSSNEQANINTDTPIVDTSMIVGTSPVTQIGRNSAAFSGYLDPKDHITNSYFEYGKDLSLSRETPVINRGIEPGLVTQFAYDLTANTRYYVRHCAVNSIDGKKCGVITSFTTKKTIVVTTTNTAATDSTETNDSEDTSAGSTEETPEIVVEYFEILIPVPSAFVSLGIQNGVSAMQTGDVITYEVTYKNTSRQTLKDGMLYVDLPADLDFLDSTRGDYSVVDHAISYEFGTIGINESGTIFVTTQLPELEDDRIPVIASAQLVHKNPENGAREGATAYDVDTRYHTLSEEQQALLAASVFGAFGGGGTTLLVLSLSVLALLLIGYYLLLNGYINPRPMNYAYAKAPAVQPIRDMTPGLNGAKRRPQRKKPVVTESHIPEPALVDEVYMGHLGR